MLGKWKDKLMGMSNRFAGKTDFLEAVCAAAALATAADGEIDDKEIEMSMKTVTSNPVLTGAFNDRQISKTMDEMLKRAESGRTGRAGLYKEIEDIANDPEMAETVYLCALDVAESDGCGKDEQQVLDRIAHRLKIDPKKFDV
jgi:tellurite resistance protein TerB